MPSGIINEKTGIELWSTWRWIADIQKLRETHITYTLGNMTSPLPEQVSLQRSFCWKKLMYLLKYLHVTALMNRSQQVRYLNKSHTCYDPERLENDFKGQPMPWTMRNFRKKRASSSAGLVGDGSSVGTGISWKDRLIGWGKEYTMSQVPVFSHT